MKPADMIGQRFGRLTVLQRNDEKSTVRKTIWHCRCDCGNEVDVISGNLLPMRHIFLVGQDHFS